MSLTQLNIWYNDQYIFTDRNTGSFLILDFDDNFM